MNALKELGTSEAIDPRISTDVTTVTGMEKLADTPAGTEFQSAECCHLPLPNVAVSAWATGVIRRRKPASSRRYRAMPSRRCICVKVAFRGPCGNGFRSADNDRRGVVGLVGGAHPRTQIDAGPDNHQIPVIQTCFVQGEFSIAIHSASLFRAPDRGSVNPSPLGLSIDRIFRQVRR